VGIAVDSATHRVYVANYGDDTVTVLDGFCGDPSQYCGTRVSFVAIIHVGSHPLGVALDAYTNRLFVTDSSDDAVTVINTETLAVVAKVSVGHAPYGVAIDSGLHHVFVSNSQDATVSVIDENVKEINYTVTSTPAVVQTVRVGLSPHGVAVDTTGDVIVANHGDNTVTIFRDSKTSPVRSFPVGAQPEAVAVDPSVHTIIVTNVGDNTVSEFTAPGANDIIYVPLRFCVLEKTSYAGTSPGFTRLGQLGRQTGPIDPASIHTISATDRAYLTKDVVRPSLAELVDAANNIWVPQAHIQFEMTGHPPFRIPVLPDPMSTNPPISGGEIYDHPLGGPIEAAGSDCLEAWNTLYPETWAGIPVVVVVNYWSGSMTLGVTTPLPDNLKDSPELCSEPRQVPSADLGSVVTTIEDPASYPTFEQDILDAPYVLAHELGHALLLGHGQGVSRPGSGLQPAGEGLTSTNPGPRIFDSYCDPQWTPTSPPGAPPSLMTQSAGQTGQLTPLQIEAARAMAALYPGSGRAYNSFETGWYGSQVVDARCEKPPCGLQPRLDVVRASLWARAAAPQATLSFSPWLISATDAKTQYFLVVRSAAGRIEGCPIARLGFPTGTMHANLAAEVVLDKGDPVSVRLWHCQDGSLRLVNPADIHVTVTNKAATHAAGSSSGLSAVSINFPARTVPPVNHGLRLEVASQDWANPRLILRIPQETQATHKIPLIVWLVIAAGLLIVIGGCITYISWRRRRLPAA